MGPSAPLLLTWGRSPGRPPPPAPAAATDFGTLPTEALNPRARHLDTMEPEEIARLMLSEELKAARAAGTRAHQIGKAARLAAGPLAAGGRPVYASARSSRQLGTLDSAACLPTLCP